MVFFYGTVSIYSYTEMIKRHRTQRLFIYIIRHNGLGVQILTSIQLTAVDIMEVLNKKLMYT